MELPSIDVAGLVERVRSQVVFVSSADRYAVEVLEILQDTHRILAKMEKSMDRLTAVATAMEQRAADLGLSPERFARLEEAVFNIERATSGLEVALAALPKPMRNRMAKAADDAREFVQEVTEQVVPERPRRAAPG